MENVKNLSEIYDVIHQNQKYHVNRGDEKNEIEYLSNLIPPKSRVLDAGCGFGLPFLKYFSDNDYQVIGTDISHESLKIAAKFAPEANLYVKDTSLLDFDENTFDLIISLYSIMHLEIEKQIQSFHKIFKMLIPGGYFRVNFASKDYTGYDEYAGIRSFDGHSLPCFHSTPEKYKEMFLDIGFEIIDAGLKSTGLAESTNWKNQKEIKLFWMLVRKPVPSVAIRFKMNSLQYKFSSLREFFQYEDSILEDCYSSKEWEADLVIAIEKNFILDRLVETWDESRQEYNYYLFPVSKESAVNFLHFVDTETGLHKSIHKAEQHGFTTERFIVDCSPELWNKSILLLPNR